MNAAQPDIALHPCTGCCTQVMVCGKMRCRVQLDHAGSWSWPMDHATRYEGVEIARRPVHDRRVA